MSDYTLSNCQFDVCRQIVELTADRVSAISYTFVCIPLQPQPEAKRKDLHNLEGNQQFGCEMASHTLLLNVTP